MKPKVPYTNDGGPPQTRGAYMRLERREKNILLMKEKEVSATWNKFESVFDKFMQNNSFERDQELLQRLGELMKQFRKERDSYLATKTRVEKTIIGQMKEK